MLWFSAGGGGGRSADGCGPDAAVGSRQRPLDGADGRIARKRAATCSAGGWC